MFQKLATTNFKKKS